MGRKSSMESAAHHSGRFPSGQWLCISSISSSNVQPTIFSTFLIHHFIGNLLHSLCKTHQKNSRLEPLSSVATAPEKQPMCRESYC
ncbi:hypothetical protein P8452_77812 [Trifolium repens]|nr:hypothetical protein P8452_77812 [Trifolium repens]